jgi:hypothetical protein
MKRQVALVVFLTFAFPMMYAQISHNGVPKISSERTVDDSGNTISNKTYKYDDQGRCIEFHESVGDAFTNTYEYPSPYTIIVKTIYASEPGTTYEGTIMLNNEGLAISFESTDTTEYYFYNSAGFDVSSYVSDPENTRADDLELDRCLVIEGNNVASDKDGNYFSYFEDKANTLGNANIGMSFFGRDNANLLKEEDVFDEYMDEVFYDYTYDFDSKGRAVVQTCESDDGLESRTVYITYTD